MHTNLEYFAYHDLIGCQSYARSKTKANKQNFSEIGIVIDESKNMLITKNNTQIKKYIKKDYIFRFKLPEEEKLLIEIDGSKIVGRPENRLRSLRNKRWKK